MLLLAYHLQNLARSPGSMYLIYDDIHRTQQSIPYERKILTIFPQIQSPSSLSTRVTFHARWIAAIAIFPNTDVGDVSQVDTRLCIHQSSPHGSRVLTSVFLLDSNDYTSRPDFKLRSLTWKQTRYREKVPV